MPNPVIKYYVPSPKYPERKAGTKQSEVWYRKGQRHRLDGPAEINYRPNGTIDTIYYYKGGRAHRTDGPAVINIDHLGNVRSEWWYANGIIHREDGPAMINRDMDGEIKVEKYYLYGKPKNYRDYMLESAKTPEEKMWRILQLG